MAQAELEVGQEGRRGHAAEALDLLEHAHLAMSPDVGLEAARDVVELAAADPAVDRDLDAAAVLAMIDHRWSALATGGLGDGRHIG